MFAAPKNASRCHVSRLQSPARTDSTKDNIRLFTIGCDASLALIRRADASLFAIQSQSGAKNMMQHHGGTGLSLECDDVRKTYEELRAKGAEFAKPPKTEPWGTSAILKDSEGNQIMLSSS